MRTEEQNAAIDAKIGDLLLSAAAGSGKTTVLTERLVKRLCDESIGLDIRRVLVVTFTRDAADELKSRIRAALDERIKSDPDSKYLRRQRLMLSSANISTIDSFLFTVLKANMNYLGLPSGMKIGDENTSLILEHNVMQTLVDSLYDKTAKITLNNNFKYIASVFSSAKKSHELADELIRVYKKLTTLSRGILMLKDSADEIRKIKTPADFFESKYGQISLEHILGELGDHKKPFSDLRPSLSSGDQPALRNVIDKITEFVDSITAFSEEHDWYGFCDAFLRFPELIKSFGNVPGGVSADEIRTKEEYNTVKDCVREKYLKRFFVPLTRKVDNIYDIEITAQKTADLIDDVYTILNAFSDELTSEKRELKIFDFDDVTRYCHDL
ncbi:MAG: UvrD-helicase domain-containing protein, partial [Clostridia bacterium]|nr:UvrD-helicase domain-containing protein [Clostridia bacterium]